MELRQVSSDLTVVVTHRGKPIAGIKIQVVPEKLTEPVFSSTTDVHGTVLIEGLMVGRYHLTASHEDFVAGKEWIEVVAVPDAKTKRRFDFQWADWSYQSRETALWHSTNENGKPGAFVRWKQVIRASTPDRILAINFCAASALARQEPRAALKARSIRSIVCAVVYRYELLSCSLVSLLCGTKGVVAFGGIHFRSAAAARLA